MKKLLIVLSSMFWLGLATADERSAAPEGYSWYESNNHVGTFLLPAQWHVLEQTDGDMAALFITPTAFQQGQAFSQGFAVNQVNRFSEKVAASPKDYAKAFITQLTEKLSPKKAYSKPSAVGSIYGLVALNPHSDPQTMMHYVAIGQDDLDRLTLIWFESPVSDWELIYELAQPMLDQFELAP